MLHALMVLLLLGAPAGEPVAVDDWESYVRIGTYAPEGIPCWGAATGTGHRVRTLYFKHPLRLLDEEGDRVRVRVDGDGIACWVEAEHVTQMHSRPVACPSGRVTMKLAPLHRLVAPGALEDATRHPAGRLFPTFYHIAMEALYPLPDGETPVTLLANDGSKIADVSAQFRRALLYQGTAALMDGRVLNVGRKLPGGRRFIVLPEGSFGLGTSGYVLYPYRSAAVDFDYLCDALGPTNGCEPGNTKRRDRKISRRNRKALAGTVLYLPRVDGVVMADGTRHDGHVCAVDVGGGIRNDRIDLFVGTDGAGNPYYPDCRRRNPLLAAGIEGLIPSDWRRFQQDEEGRWQRVEQTEYRRVVPHKGLEVVALPGVQCARKLRPVQEAK